MAVRVFVKVDSRGVRRTFAELTDNDAAKVEGLRRSMERIGFISTDEFMVHERRKTSPNPSATLIHRDTGKLTRSLIGQFSFARGLGGSQDSIRRIKKIGDDYRATFGTSVFYAKFHEFGSSIHPKRPFLNPATELAVRRGDIEKIFEEEFRRHVRKVNN